MIKGQFFSLEETEDKQNELYNILDETQLLETLIGNIAIDDFIDLIDREYVNKDFKRLLDFIKDSVYGDVKSIILETLVDKDT
jgi:hypothetical protein